MNRLLIVALLVVTFVPNSANGGKIAEVFSLDIFDIKWGASETEVASILPGGKFKKMSGYRMYILKDGRELFGIPRKPSDKIWFQFNADGKFNGVTIEFPKANDKGFGELQNKLSTLFGSPQSQPNAFGVPIISWPQDEGIKISMIFTAGVLGGSKLNFLIENKGLTSDGITKESLGF